MRINTGCFLNGCKCFDPEDEDGVGIKADREWQSLTDEEIKGLVHLIDWTAGWTYGDFARAIEAKLKDKNFVGVS